MKLGNEILWEDISIGEVFAADGCIDIWYKISDEKALYLGGDMGRDCDCSLMNASTPDNCKIGKTANIAWWMDNLYKLPKSVQNYWKNQ